MNTTGEQPQGPVSQASEVMKSLALGIVGDLGRLLKEQGLGQQPIKIVEALVFAMFVVTETFTAVKKGLEEARAELDRFHEDMIEYIFTEYYYKTNKAKDTAEVETRFQELNQLINDRYQEYRQDMHEDYHDQQMNFRRTFASLTQHLLPEPLADGGDKDRLVAAFTVKLGHFWSGCLASFKPARSEEKSGPVPAG
jgi:hypothetical protein